jgi:hypothetical protein
MSRKVTVIAVLTFSLVAVAHLIAQDAVPNPKDTVTVEGILEKYIESLGGKEAIEKLTTRMCTGKVTTDLSSREIPIFEAYWFETYAKSSGECLVTIYTGHGTERSGYDGETGWSEDKCGAKENENAVGTKLAFLLNPQGPLNVQKYFPNLQLIGTDQISEKTVYVLYSPELSETHYALYFDSESGLLVRIGYYWTITDYREVDGVLFPYRVSASRKGGSTTYEFSEVKHNVEMSDTLFEMPGEN